MKTNIKEIPFEQIDMAVNFANKQFGLDFYKIEPRLYRYNLGKTYGCFVDEKLVGMFSTYDIFYHDLRGISIGTVCVDVTFRNQGIMSNMLDYAERYLYEGYDFALLCGSKSRYEKFGFARCISYASFSYSSKGENDIDIVQVLDNNYDKKLFKIDQIYGNGVKRSEKMFSVLSNASNSIFYLCDGEKESFAVMKNDNLIYLCGNIDIQKVVNAVSQGLNLPKINIFADCNTRGFELAKKSNKYVIVTEANIKILDASKVIKYATPKQKEFEFDFNIDGKCIQVSCVDNVINARKIETSNNNISEIDFCYQLFNYNPFDCNNVSKSLYLCLPYTFATIDCI